MDFPPAAGFDQLNTSATVQLYADPACTTPAGGLISLQGPTKIKRTAPAGTMPTRTIDTEIISMSLTGQGPILLIEAPGGSDPNNPLAPPCNTPGPAVGGGPGCSPGQIQSQPGSGDFPADSFFDVFFEVHIPGGQRLYNQVPVQMQAVINRIPPEGTIYIPPVNCIPLHSVTSPGPPVIFLGHAQHKVEPKTHYKCYKAKDLKLPKFVPVIVSLDDQFGPQPQVEVKKPFLLCTPTSKNGEPVEDPEGHRCCYKVKGPKFAVDKKVEVSDQFGSLQLGKIKKAQLLCTSCSKNEIP
jgi:hypothetical protein